MYKLVENSIQRLTNDETVVTIPRSGGNRGYQQFLRDVQQNGTSIVEGVDIIEPNYAALRTGEDGYAPIAEQLDMQSKANGSWEAHILDVKTRYPKTIVGGVTIAPVPDWVREEAGKVKSRNMI